MKQQPRFGFVGWIATRIHHLLLPVDALRLSTLRGTFFICWGDETLNMIVSIRVLKIFADRSSSRIVFIPNSEKCFFRILSQPLELGNERDHAR